MAKFKVGQRVKVIHSSDPFDELFEDDKGVSADGKLLVGQFGTVYEAWEPGPSADFDLSVKLDGDDVDEYYFFDGEVELIETK
jgi:hypothetical protein